MTAVLLALMAFQITGQELHEWFGAGMLVGMVGKKVKDRSIPKAAVRVLRVFAVLIAKYGAVCFYRANIISYMLLKNRFAFFNNGFYYGTCIGRMWEHRDCGTE